MERQHPNNREENNMKERKNEVRRGDTVKIENRLYKVTAVENYGFFVQGRRYIVLHTDEYEIVERKQ